MFKNCKSRQSEINKYTSLSTLSFYEEQKNTMKITSNEIIEQDELQIITEKYISVYENAKTTDIARHINQQIAEGKKEIFADIAFLEAPKPTGTNYVDIEQNTK